VDDFLSGVEEYFNDMFSPPRSLRSWWEEVQIDMPTLGAQLAEWPTLYSYFGALLVQASEKHEEAKTELDAIRADVRLSAYERRKSMGFSVGDTFLKAEIDSDERVKTARLSLRKASRVKKLCEVAVNAFESKLKAMRSLGARERAEMEGIDPSVRDQMSRGTGTSREVGRHNTFYSGRHSGSNGDLSGTMPDVVRTTPTRSPDSSEQDNIVRGATKQGQFFKPGTDWFSGENE